jgi:Holliday junction resolvase RusA-like endonuclease
MIEFFAPCLPPTRTSQFKRVNHKTGVFFKDKTMEKDIETVQSVLRPHQPEAPVPGLVSLTIEATWPWRKADLSTAKKRTQAKELGRIRHGSYPDADNFAKQIQDILVGLRFIEKDQYVAELTVRKFFGEKPGLRVVIKALEGAE